MLSDPHLFLPAHNPLLLTLILLRFFLLYFRFIADTNMSLKKKQTVYRLPLLIISGGNPCQISFCCATAANLPYIRVVHLLSHRHDGLLTLEASSAPRPRLSLRSLWCSFHGCNTFAAWQWTSWFLTEIVVFFNHALSTPILWFVPSIAR